MGKSRKNSDALAAMRVQLKDLINRSYPTVEQFCWHKDLNKATISNFLKGKKDFQLSTLVKIADALKMKLTIRLD